MKLKKRKQKKNRIARVLWAFSSFSTPHTPTFTCRPCCSLSLQMCAQRCAETHLLFRDQTFLCIALLTR